MTIQQSSYSSRILLQAIWPHLSRRRQSQLSVLLLVMLSSGLAELVSLGAVLPFLAALSNPQQLWQQPLIHQLVLLVGYSQPQQLVLPATAAFALAAVLAALIRLLNLWLNGRLAAAVGSDLSCEAYRRTLYQPYGVHVQRNSSSVINSITIQVGQTVAAISALFQVLTSVVVVICLFTGLLLIDATVALAAAALFSGAYLALAFFSRRELRINGEKIAESSIFQLKALQEGLGAIRDVLLDGNQITYLQIYRQADRPNRQLFAKNNFIITFPRFAIEALGMVAIALLGGVLVAQQGSGGAVIPLLGALALGAQRLLPALQQIYSGWGSLKSFNAPLQAVLDMINQPLPPLITKAKPMVMRSGIRLEGIHFRYGAQQPLVINRLDLEIRRGERIGLIGSTGSGKSTVIDILMCLLEPSVGRVLVDEIDLYDPENSERVASWRATIAHVPQSIYLADSSIAENIAFGIPKHLIDFERVKKAAEWAQISSFIESMLDGYSSFVGERGIRLSGGQRQRLGIARALYKEASVIVFDEATSALDTSTEEAVMQSIDSLSRDLTVVMIAHRLSTIARCDRVVRLEQGKIVAIGPPSLILNQDC